VNLYEPALPQNVGLEGEIERFLDEVVGDDGEGLSLVARAIAKRSKR